MKDKSERGQISVLLPSRRAEQQVRAFALLHGHDTPAALIRALLQTAMRADERFADIDLDVSPPGGYRGCKTDAGADST